MDALHASCPSTPLAEVSIPIHKIRNEHKMVFSGQFTPCSSLFMDSLVAEALSNDTWPSEQNAYCWLQEKTMASMGEYANETHKMRKNKNPRAYLLSCLAVSFMAKTNDAIGADSMISPLYTCCMKYGALSLRSSTWIMAEHVADADAIFVARTVKL